MRGFDEAAFVGRNAFLSVTNPGPGTDPVIVQLTSGLASPLQITSLLQSTITATNLTTGMTGFITVTDSDSLKVTPAGDLALTGEGDKLIVFVHNIRHGQPVGQLCSIGRHWQRGRYGISNC